jgi:hypothetical protein
MKMESNFQLIIWSSDYSIITLGEYEIKKKTTFELGRKSEAGGNLEDTSDKVQGGAKAVANKAKDPDRNLDTEYQKEKVKEKLD